MSSRSRPRSGGAVAGKRLSRQKAESEKERKGDGGGVGARLGMVISVLGRRVRGSERR